MGTSWSTGRFDDILMNSIDRLSFSNRFVCHSMDRNSF